MRRIAWLLLILSTPMLQADILHLRDGSRYYGKLIRQDNATVVFRIATDRRGSAIVRSFPASSIRRVERTTRSLPPQIEEYEADTSEQRQVDEDFEQMLREAFELVDDRDLRSALRALQRIVSRAPPSVLAGLDAQTLTVRGESLDAFLATVRINEALAGSAGHVFDLRFATRFEAVALGEQIEEKHDRLLDSVYLDRSISEWSNRPNAYARLQNDAPRMVHDARNAAAMIGARIRFDPRLRTDKQQRAVLVRRRDSLARFLLRM